MVNDYSTEIKLEGKPVILSKSSNEVDLKQEILTLAKISVAK